MNRWITKFCIAAFCGVLILGLSRSSHAAILFDPDGSFGGTPAISVGTFDWLPGNALADGGSTSIGAFPTATPFNFFYQARLAATTATAAGATPNTPSNFTSGADQLTLVAAATEVVTTFTPGAISSATFGLAAPVDQTVNYFEIWFDPTPDANDLTGTGFNGYAVAPAGGAFGTGTNVGLAADSDSVLILSGQISTLFSTFASFPITGDLDQSGGTDNYPGIDSVTGTGGSHLVMDVNVLYYDPTFFPQSTITRLFFDSLQADPFISVDPSARFVKKLGIADGTLPGAVSPGAVPVIDGAGAGPGGGSLGTVNGGGTGPDVQFTVDGNNTFEGFTVPEPGSLTIFSLFLLGGAGLGGLRRRVRRNA